LKLLNIIKPNKIYFGQKDFQQLVILKKMISDLDVNTEVIECETVREEDGLALSSRNAYLSADERKNANILFRALNLVEQEIKKGKSPKSAKDKAVRLLKSNYFIKKIDYFDIRNPADLKPVKKKDRKNKKILVAAAAWLGATRLIDNKVIDV
jgi:pantoate--beta-alanine ligase